MIGIHERDHHDAAGMFHDVAIPPAVRLGDPHHPKAAGREHDFATAGRWRSRLSLTQRQLDDAHGNAPDIDRGGGRARLDREHGQPEPGTGAARRPSRRDHPALDASGTDSLARGERLPGGEADEPAIHMPEGVEPRDRLLPEVAAFRERDRRGTAAEFLGQRLGRNIARRWPACSDAQLLEHRWLGRRAARRLERHHERQSISARRLHEDASRPGPGHGDDSHGDAADRALHMAPRPRRHGHADECPNHAGGCGAYHDDIHPSGGCIDDLEPFTNVIALEVLGQRHGAAGKRIDPHAVVGAQDRRQSEHLSLGVCEESLRARTGLQRADRRRCEAIDKSLRVGAAYEHGRPGTGVEPAGGRSGGRGVHARRLSSKRMAGPRLPKRVCEADLPSEIPARAENFSVSRERCPAPLRTSVTATIAAATGCPVPDAETPVRHALMTKEGFDGHCRLCHRMRRRLR